MQFISPAGGLHYHFKAIRHSGKLWGSFQNSISTWLSNWPVKSDSILLIGPSGGYTLPLQWLKQFKNTSAIEPDPVARLIFKSKLARPVTWLKNDWFRPSGDGKNFPLDFFGQLCEKQPDSPILFCNLLGQLPLIYRREIQKNEAGFLNWQKDFASFLRDKTFASYHDLYSSNSDFEISNRSTKEIKPVSSTATIIDHQISDMFSNFPNREYLKWTLTPKQFHLIETVWNVG